MDIFVIKFAIDNEYCFLGDSKRKKKKREATMPMKIVYNKSNDTFGE